MTKSERTPKHKHSFWPDGETSRVCEKPDAVPRYDLEERTARFGEAIIDFAKRIPRGPLTDRTIDQLVGAGTSVGANYIEADDSVFNKEFLKCIGAARKNRARRSISYEWSLAPFLNYKATQESSGWRARALHLIFARIWRTGKEKE